MIGTLEADEKRHAIWEYLKENNPGAYGAVRRSALNVGTNLPGELGRSLGISGYHLAQEVKAAKEKPKAVFGRLLASLRPASLASAPRFPLRLCFYAFVFISLPLLDIAEHFPYPDSSSRFTIEARGSRLPCAFSHITRKDTLYAFPLGIRCDARFEEDACSLAARACLGVRHVARHGERGC